MLSTVYNRDRISMKRRTCTLVVTHQCNLNCVYCYETHKSAKAMPLDVAKRIIDAEFDFMARTDKFDEIVFDFIGGEPLLQFDLIREIAEWVWSTCRRVPHVLYATTNGTLLTEDRKHWFRQNNRRFGLGLSLDGTPEMHNRNRGMSFDRIDLDFFLENWPEQGIKMTISCDTVGSLAEGVIYLQEKGFQVHANAGYGMPWNDHTLDIYARELRKLADYYLEHEDVPPISLLDLKIQYALKSPDIVQRKYCGTGTHMVTYDVDGKPYPCHLFTPLVLGESRSGALMDVKFDECSTVADPSCADCTVRNLCPTCYGFNYKSTGDVALRDSMMCRLFKTQAQVSCYYHTQLLKRKRRVGPLSVDDIKKANACLKIMAGLTV